MATPQLNVGSFSNVTKNQLNENRMQQAIANNELYKTSGGGPYVCPITYDSKTQNNIMTDVCKTNNFASVVKDGTQQGGKLKRKTKKRKTKKRKSKKKSKRRK